MLPALVSGLQGPVITSAVNEQVIVENIESKVKPTEPKWEVIVAPLVARVEADNARIAAELEAARVAEEAKQLAAQQAAAQATAFQPPQPVAATYSVVNHNSTTVTNGNAGGLTGSRGYARAGGNCVLEPGVNNPFNGTNPISWPATSYQPWIGATALFHYNHTGVLVGMWDNGDLEIRHQNYQGNQTRFPRSAIRGYR